MADVVEEVICAYDCYPPDLEFLLFTAAPLLVVAVGVTRIRSWRGVFLVAAAAQATVEILELLLRASFVNGFFGWLSWRYPIEQQNFWIGELIAYGFALGASAVSHATVQIIRHASRGGTWRMLRYAVAALAVTVSISTYQYLAPKYEGRPDLVPARVMETFREVREQLGSQCSLASVQAVPITPRQALAPSREIEPVPTSMPDEFAALPIVSFSSFHADAHLLSHIEPFRRPQSGVHPWALLKLVVDESGDVVFAMPADAPADLHDRAVAVAKTWKFKPYKRDGKPTAVQLINIEIPVFGPELRSSSMPIPGQIQDLSSLRIRLLHHSTFAGDRGYSVTVRGDGLVIYEGRQNVSLSGEHCAVIAAEDVAELFKRIVAADFSTLRETYYNEPRDAPGAEVSVTFDGQTFRVFDGDGVLVGMPDAVTQVQDLINDMTASDRWVTGSALTRPSLIAEGWDFTRSDDANFTMATGLAKHGDAETLGELLAMNLPVDASTRWSNPMLAAAERGEVEMVHEFLDTPAEWNPEILDLVLSEISKHGDETLVARLVERGANVNADTQGGRPLMMAAQSGAPAVVSKLLELGADPRAKDDYGRDALHYTGRHIPNVITTTGHENRRLVVEILVASGLSVHSRDKYQKTPLMNNWDGMPEVAHALIALGADVNAKSIDGTTPLMTNRNELALRLLLNAGANPYARDNEGRSAFDHAVSAAEDEDGDHDQAPVTVLGQWMKAHPEKQPRDRK